MNMSHRGKDAATTIDRKLSGTHSLSGRDDNKIIGLNGKFLRFSNEKSIIFF
jgi:hypothetical protein